MIADTPCATELVNLLSKQLIASTYKFLALFAIL